MGNKRKKKEGQRRRWRDRDAEEKEEKEEVGCSRSQCSILFEGVQYVYIIIFFFTFLRTQAFFKNSPWATSDATTAKVGYAVTVA